MYHFVYAVCLVYNISGEPVNPCYMEESPEYYSSRPQCESAARQHEMHRHRQFEEQFPNASLVYNTPCGKVKGTYQ